ncbi:MAG TPA: hypothetical protein PKH10_13905, partial [bacterium]|nr:hypothetical protein [bacterium]
TTITKLYLRGLPLLETCDLCETLESVTDELRVDCTVLSADKPRFPVMSDIAYLRFGITLYGGDGYDNEAYNTVPTDALPLFGQTVTVPSAWIYAVRADDLSVLAGFTPTFVKMEALTASSLDGPVISEEMSGVEITNNDLLTDISSLGALKSVAGGEFVTTSQLRITGNALLADISPLMGITAVNPVVYLNITDNAALSQADAQKVADHFVNDLGLPSSHVKVSGNCAACPGLIP